MVLNGCSTNSLICDEPPGQLLVRAGSLDEFDGKTELDLINFTAKTIVKHNKNRSQLNNLIDWHVKE